MKRTSLNFILVLFSLIIMMTSAAYAEETEQPLDPEAAAEVNATIKSSHIFSSDIEPTGSEIDITTTRLSADYNYKLSNGLPIDMAISIAHKDINTDSPVELPSNLEARRLKLGTKFPVPFVSDDRFFMGIDILPTFNTDEWKWESGAFRLPFRSYVIFKESEDFILVGGVTVRPEYDREVLPLIGLVYRPNDRLSFNLASDDPNVSYKLSDATLLRWEFQYAYDEYEVTRGGQKGVVLQYQEISSGFGIEHQLNDSLKGIVSAGAVFNRQLEYKDEVGKVTPDAGVYASAQLTATF